MLCLVINCVCARCFFGLSFVSVVFTHSSVSCYAWFFSLSSCTFSVLAVAFFLRFFNLTFRFDWKLTIKHLPGAMNEYCFGGDDCMHRWSFFRMKWTCFRHTMYEESGHITTSFSINFVNNARFARSVWMFFICLYWRWFGGEERGVDNVKNQIQMVFLVEIIGVQFRHHTLIYTLHTLVWRLGYKFRLRYVRITEFHVKAKKTLRDKNHLRTTENGSNFTF